MGTDTIRTLILQGQIDQAQAHITAEELSRQVVVHRLPKHPVMAFWTALGYEVRCRGWEGPRGGERWYEVAIAGPGVDVREVAADRDEAYLKAHVLASLQREGGVHG